MFGSIKWEEKTLMLSILPFFLVRYSVTQLLDMLKIELK